MLFPFRVRYLEDLLPNEFCNYRVYRPSGWPGIKYRPVIP